MSKVTLEYGTEGDGLAAGPPAAQSPAARSPGAKPPDLPAERDWQWLLFELLRAFLEVVLKWLGTSRSMRAVASKAVENARAERRV